MGGMDMSSSGPFRPTNQKIARGYWYAIAGIVGLLTIFRILRVLENRQQRHADQRTVAMRLSRLRGGFQQTLATTVTVLRELSYPQPVYFTGRFSKYFTPLPLGRWLILAVYWTVLLSFLWTNTILSSSDPMYPYKWEIVGFRAAWVSVAQIPFIYLLSCKFNPISLLTGISYERFNWLHRWAARTVFLTIIVHWSFFFQEWSLAGFVKLQLEMMPMVKYGFGAWAVIGWMIFSGFGFFRALSYEIFVAQHICAAATLLWLLYVHVPAYARYNIYMAIAFVAFDWISRIGWALLRNTHILDNVRGGDPGYLARLETLPGGMVRITIQDTAFSWKAGQHAYISIPRIGPLELHPFTIANVSASGRDGGIASMKMLVKAHSGFSRRLYKAASQQDSQSTTYRAFISGPWGSPPDLRHYESLVFIACSSGVSFTMTLLQDIVGKQTSKRKIVFHWIIRSDDHLSWFRPELLDTVETARRSSLRLQIFVHVTQFSPTTLRVSSSAGDEASLQVTTCTSDSGSDLVPSSSSGTSLADEKTPFSSAVEDIPTASKVTITHDGRPSIECLIRPVVEAAHGETAVVVCGGVSITAQARTFVAALSDERAVHKGSGAKGIFLFTETYGW